MYIYTNVHTHTHVCMHAVYYIMHACVCERVCVCFCVCIRLVQSGSVWEFEESNAPVSMTDQSNGGTVHSQGSHVEPDDSRQHINVVSRLCVMLDLAQNPPGKRKRGKEDWDIRGPDPNLGKRDSPSSVV